MHACSRQTDITMRIQSGGRDDLAAPPPTTTVRDWNARGMAQSTTGIGTALALAVAPARWGRRGTTRAISRTRRRGAVNRRGQQSRSCHGEPCKAGAAGGRGISGGGAGKSKVSRYRRARVTQGGQRSLLGSRTTRSRMPQKAWYSLGFSFSLTHTHTPHVLCVCVAACGRVTRQRKWATADGSRRLTSRRTLPKRLSRIEVGRVVIMDHHVLVLVLVLVHVLVIVPTCGATQVPMRAGAGAGAGAWRATRDI